MQKIKAVPGIVLIYVNQRVDDEFTQCCLSVFDDNHDDTEDGEYNSQCTVQCFG